MDLMDLLEPLIKNKPIRRNILLSLVGTVCAALLIISVWSVPPPEEQPDQGPFVIIETTPTPEIPPDDDPVEIPEQTPEPTPDVTPEPKPASPLTGLPMDEEKIRYRPLAIVLSNIPEALPMNGVSDADIIYEVLVEGGLTRMLALYQDFTNVRMVGSIRSARHYTVEIAESFDAIFVTAGGSPQAYDEVSARKITHLDEVGGNRREIFFRDRTRINGRRLDGLHAVVTTGERVVQWFPEYNIRLEHDDDYEHGLLFTDDGTPSGGGSAVEVVCRFSAGKSSIFSYNADMQTYRLRQFNRDFIDANDNSYPSFTNILILKTSVSGIPGDYAGRRNIVTVGSGEGYFVCGGRYVEIDWFRDDKDTPFYYTLKDGTPLELGRGKTFVCIIPTNMSATFE